ncbi:heavy metal tolerance protein [Aspergillus lentulus]|nr:heavy metal tolerance protein [Aspergillus lentulus]
MDLKTACYCTVCKQGTFQALQDLIAHVYYGEQERYTGIYYTIEQFSYKQLTNAAFSPVLVLLMEFHSEQDTAEVMKAIEQGAALTNVLETAFVEIAPAIIDLFVAVSFLHVKFNSLAALWLVVDLIDAERLLDLLTTKPTVTDKPGAFDLGLVQGYVEFENVFFSYNNGKPALCGINISAAPGDTIALVGTTGAGKSSLVKLLLRYYDVTSGCIKIDGHDIRDVTQSSLRDALGIVSQNPVLFSASIMENLRYAKLDASDEEIYRACRAAAIHDRIFSFPKGYQTQVGEQGVKLSRGEVQRLAIARAFLKDPSILVLDEATSAVDTEAEAKKKR